MAPLRQYAVLGPLQSGAETRAFLGCEVIDGAPHPDLPVVVVWLPDHVTSDPKQVARLQRETAFVTQLRHKNIIRIHGLECFEEGWARIVAFVDGEPLSRILARAKEEGKALDPLLAARIMTEVCEGVHYAHEEGQARYAGRPIVHGGIRPDTLLITFQGVMMVTGYGASVLAPSLQSTSNPERYAYLAPEQIIGGKSTASPATDVYAMGALLHELLAGEAPFVRSPDIERAILTGDPPTIEGEGVLGKLGNIATTALSKRGTDRFESAAVMKEAILSAIGEGVLPTQQDVAAFVCGLIPESSPERVGRKDLLRGAVDPDSVTVLSRPSRVEGAGRASSVASDLAVDAADGAGSSRRVPKPRNEETVVDGRPPAQVSIQSPRADDDRPVPRPRDEVTVIEKPDYGGAIDPVSSRSSNGPSASDELPLVIPAAPQDESVTEADTNPFSIAAIEGNLDRARPAAASAGAWLDTEPTGQMTAIAAQAAAQQPLVETVAGAGGASYVSGAPQKVPAPMFGAAPPAGGGSTVGGASSGPTGGVAFPGAPDRGPGAMTPLMAANAMHGGDGMQPSPMGPYIAQSQSAAPYGVGPRPSATSGAGSGSDDLGRPTRRPLERSESVITAFDRKVGDSSRSVLIAILAAAAILLAGVFYFASPPPDVALEEQGEVRHALPKELVKAALTKPKEKDPTEIEEQRIPVEASTPTSGAAAAAPAEGGDLQPAPVTEFGRINLKSDPEVDVYDGTEYLGRTPLTAKLPAGNRKLRFTDKKTGLNIYRTYKIPAGGERRAEESFGTSDLIVEAPDGASILLNSRFIGKAPLEPIKIYEGKYHLKVTHDGKTWADWFDAPPGKKINYRVNLRD